MSEIICRVCVLYRCVLPAAHRQPGHSGQSQQGGTRVHRVQAVLGQPRFGGHMGSRGPHQQPQRYGEVVLSGKRLNPKILLYVKSTCKTNLYHGNDCNQSSQDTIHSKRNIFRQFFFTFQHGPNRLLLVLLMGWAFDVSNSITLHELLPLCTAFIPMSQTKYSCLYIIMQFWAKIDFWRAAINLFYLLSVVGRTIEGRADTDIWTTIIFLLHEEQHCTALNGIRGPTAFLLQEEQHCTALNGIWGPTLFLLQQDQATVQLELIFEPCRSLYCRKNNRRQSWHWYLNNDYLSVAWRTTLYALNGIWEPTIFLLQQDQATVQLLMVPDGRRSFCCSKTKQPCSS